MHMRLIPRMQEAIADVNLGLCAVVGSIASHGLRSRARIDCWCPAMEADCIISRSAEDEGVSVKSHKKSFLNP